MASNTGEGGCVTLTWEIQNFGLLIPLEEKSLRTPFWATGHTGKSVWRRLRIRFTGSEILLTLCPATGCLLLDCCEVSLISSCMEVPLKLYYRELNRWSYAVERYAVFGGKRQSILPNDTLTLRCKMWEKTMRSRKFRINSVLHRFSFLWNIENFHPHQRQSKYFEEEDFLFKAFLHSKNKKGNHDFTLVDVSSMEHCISPIDCKLYATDGDVHVIGKYLDQFNNTNYVTKICLNGTGLNLQLESVFAVHKVCQDPSKLQSPPRYENVPEAVSGVLGEDLLLLYRDKLFSDATLNAEGKSFHVHRNILSARSPVFRTMFEKDEMSDGRSGAVDIDDVDSETLDRMLVYLYGGDSFGSVQQWEETSALYNAADKYDIQPLKHKCASSLKDSLTVDNACEALVLADKHSDDQLMKCIVDFFRQNEEVMCSEKWDSLQKSNSMLAAKILKEILLREIYVKIKNK